MNDDEKYFGKQRSGTRLHHIALYLLEQMQPFGSFTLVAPQLIETS